MRQSEICCWLLASISLWLRGSGWHRGTRGDLRLSSQGAVGGVYVLRLEEGRYYVGKTGRAVETRVEEHFSSPKPAWIKSHRPLEAVRPITFIPSDLESWERAEVLERMWVHGAARVRGWQFTRLDLTPTQRTQIVVELCERKNLCRRCGQAGHMYSSCRKAMQKASWTSAIFEESYRSNISVNDSPLKTPSFEISIPQPPKLNENEGQGRWDWTTALRGIIANDAVQFNLLASLR